MIVLGTSRNLVVLTSLVSNCFDLDFSGSYRKRLSSRLFEVDASLRLEYFAPILSAPRHPITVGPTEVEALFAKST